MVDQRRTIFVKKVDEAYEITNGRRDRTHTGDF